MMHQCVCVCNWCLELWFISFAGCRDAAQRPRGNWTDIKRSRTIILHTPHSPSCAGVPAACSWYRLPFTSEDTRASAYAFSSFKDTVALLCVHSTVLPIRYSELRPSLLLLTSSIICDFCYFSHTKVQPALGRLLEMYLTKADGITVCYNLKNTIYCKGKSKVLHYPKSQRGIFKSSVWFVTHCIVWLW